nr:reverse transcriptase domain-containing protein [Tanacetum cinerariifolium]
MNFMVVKSMSPYNGIIGRPGLKAIQAVPSTVHGMLKFPVEGGIATIRSTILIPTECASVTTSFVIPREERTCPANFIVALHPDFPDQEVVIGGSLSDKGRTELCSSTDSTSEKRQKKRSQAPERANAIQAEVQKLVDTEIIREVYYHDWISNPVMVKKHDGSWRMCVDFTDLNKACPQDCYPLPEIDSKVESLSVLQLPSPRTIKEVQSLNGKLASLNRFLFKSAKKSLLLFQTLKKCIKKSDFRWIAKAEQAFQQLKQHLSELPLLVAPKPQEELIMYLSATYGALSAVLMTERGTTQTPIYFISRELQGPKLNYSSMEKLVLSLVFVAKSIRQYFQSIMLGGHNITYRLRTSVKGQILADFLVEIPGDVSQAAPAAVTQEEPWTLFTDGSSCVDGSGTGLILTNPKGVEFTYTSRFQFTASNNEAEYEALVAGLRIAGRMGVKNVQVNVDSKLVANQVLGTYVAKEDNMIKYLEIVKGLVSGLTTFLISQMPRSKKKKADALSKITSTSFAHLSKQVLVEVLENKSIKEKEVAAVIEEDGPRSVVAKAVRLGYYWPTMHKDACDVIRKCNHCQIHRPVTRHPQQSLTPSTAPWPFYKWRIDIAGPFPEGPRKVKFLMVAMDYFTKWIEAKTVATITRGQFADNPFKDWCDKLNITQWFTSVKHPQSNGLVERVNRSLGEGIKERLGERNKNWMEELPHVLWAHRTMIKSSHGDTPFSLIYGTEAVIPTEIEMPTYRTAVVDVVNNDEELRLNLDLLEERQERAAVREARAKSKMMKYYNARVRDVAFKPCDFVYRSNDASHATAGEKLGPKWEGPYEVTEALGNGAYKLRSTNGTVLPRTWNVANLKRCYL